MSERKPNEPPIEPRGRRTPVVAVAAGGSTRREERVLPALSPGEILLRLRGCGLCGTDLFKLDHQSAPDGAVLGHEVVGDVVETRAPERFAIGDRVVVPHHVPCGECALCRRGSETMCDVFRENLLSPGGFSEFLVVGERAVRLAAQLVPEEISDDAAVFLEPAACVLRGIERSALAAVPEEIEPSGCAVVIGGGSMGLLHLLTLRAWRPSLRIVLSDPVAERRRLALELGAAAAPPPGEEAGSAVEALTSGLGADAAFDTVGGAAVLDGALALLREGGSAVLFAHARDGEAPSFHLNSLFKSERRVLGTYSGSLREQRTVFEWIAAGRLDASPLVTHRLPLARFDEAVALVRRREALKILLVPDSRSA